jgi:predicted ATPase/class 3 adenylate cyclase
MRCSKCGSENREGRKFCTKCGTPFLATCPKCGAAVGPDESFCGECGTALGDTAPAAADGAQSATAAVGGERRHLTILFCDLVGSVTLTSQLDPEEWRATVAGYQRAASEAITRFGGAVVRYIGDGIMAFFGYPVAHDNDAERAVHAGLAILDAVSQLNQQPTHLKLSVRIGIDSGPVVVGTGAGQAVDAFGDAANIAARVQAAAEADTVVVTGGTHRLISGLFVVEDRGAQALKGIEPPVQLYRVIRPSGMRSRFEATAAAGGLTPFVGREDELRSLLNRWERVREGEGQVITIIGEAGIGKSRLVRHFHDAIAGTPHTWLQCASGPFFQNTPFYAVAQMLRQSFDWDQGLSGFEASFREAGVKADEAVPLMAPLLDLPAHANYPPSTLTAEQQRKRLMATLVQWTFGAAKGQPLVIAIEDLHWADPSTLELIQLLVVQGATVKLLLLCTARSEFLPSWPLQAHHAQLTLNRLSARDVRTMVREVAARKGLSDETVAAVVDRTGGVPLFVEELTRAVLESGDAKLSGRAIPATLHDSLMARLDRLGPAKEVIQIGAVLGADFSYELLRAVDPIAEADLQRALHSLTHAELLYVRGIAPDATYQFKHALIRDAAYEALLKSRRKELHRLAAIAIDEQFPAIREAHPEVLARHWSEASEIDPAIAAWQKAGEQALQRSAHSEAIRNLTTALKLLSTLPDDQAHIHRELLLQLALGVALIATKGFTAPEVESAYARARALCQQTGETQHLFPVLWGLWAFYLVRADLSTARELAEELLALAQSGKDPTLLLEAHYALGATLRVLGDLVAARAHFEKTTALYNPQQHHSLAFLYGSYDSGMGSLSLTAFILCLLGYPDRALKKSLEARALAQALAHPFSLALARLWASWLHQLRRDERAAQEEAEEVIRLSTEQEFPQWIAMGMIYRGWALVMQEQNAEGLAQLQKGLTDLLATGAESDRGYCLALLAEAHGRSGQVEEGLSVLANAMAQVARTGERFYEAELWRLRGMLTLKSTLPRTRCQLEGEAEECFCKAIAIARDQQAKALELRAAVSLSRLWEQQGKQGEAHKMLSEIYNWFTEGFDTADLKDARALLDELGV